MCSVVKKWFSSAMDYPSVATRCLTCSVLPRPISSARMQLRRWYHENSSQFTPSIWYSRSTTPFFKGMLVLYCLYDSGGGR